MSSLLDISRQILLLYHRYQTLTVPEDEAASCLLVNGSLLVPHSSEIPLSSQVESLEFYLNSNNIIFSLYLGLQRKNQLLSEGSTIVRIPKNRSWSFRFVFIDKKVEKYQKIVNLEINNLYIYIYAHVVSRFRIQTLYLHLHTAPPCRTRPHAAHGYC